MASSLHLDLKFLEAPGPLLLYVADMSLKALHARTMTTNAKTSMRVPKWSSDAPYLRTGAGNAHGWRARHRSAESPAAAASAPANSSPSSHRETFCDWMALNWS
jgi:hypothetical protein